MPAAALRVCLPARGRRAAVALAIAAVLAVTLGGGRAEAAVGSGVSYWGGPVMHSTNAILVQWGPSAGTYAGQDESFINYVAKQSGTVADPFASLAEYTDSAGDIAPYATFGGLYTIAPLVPSGGITEQQVETELRRDVAAGTLPSPAGDGLSTAYFVLFAPGTNLQDAQGHPQNGTGGWCTRYGDAQAGGSSPHILFAMLADPSTTTACGSTGQQPQNEATVALSGVWASMLASPLQAAGPALGPPTAWYGNAGSVADVCAGDTASDGPFTVQAIWSQRSLSCVGSGANLFAPPTVSLYVPLTVTAGLPATFTATASTSNATDTNMYQTHSYMLPAGVSSYTWAFGDGGTAAGAASATHTFATSAQYSVALSVTDALGFTATNTSQVFVSPQTPATQPSGGVTAPTGSTTPTPCGSGSGSGGSGGSGSGGSGSGGSGSGSGGSGSGGSGSGSTATSGLACPGTTPPASKKPKVVAHAAIVYAGGVSLTGLGPGMGWLLNAGQGVRCPIGGTVCITKFKLVTSKGVVIAQGTTTEGDGRYVVLRAALTSAGVWLVSHHGTVAATLTVVVSHGADAPLTTTRVVNVSTPRHQHK